MRIVLASLVMLAALAAGCGSSGGEDSTARRAETVAPAPVDWPPIDASVGRDASPADATAFHEAVEAGLAPALAPRLGAVRYIPPGVEFQGARLRLLLAPAGDAGWCLGLAFESGPEGRPAVHVNPSCVLDAKAGPALAVATLGGPQPAWMSREGGTVVYGRGRAARIEIEMSDGTVEGFAPDSEGSFAMGPFERGRTPRVVVARTASGFEVARVELWSEADTREIVELPQEPDDTDSPRCARIGLPLIGRSGTGYATFAVVGTGTEPEAPNPSAMPAGEGGLTLLGTLPAAAREVELRFAADRERHPVPDSCYMIGISAERIASNGPPTAVVALGQDGAVLETQAVRPTWLDFPPLP